MVLTKEPVVSQGGEHSGADDFYFSLPRPEMLEYVPASAKRVLDVGCGHGRFGLGVKERFGAEVWGIELDIDAARHAEGVLDVVHSGSVEACIEGLPTGHFDCISFNDVLEHLQEPGEVLITIQRLLSPDGVVVASIPNVRYYRSLRHILLDGDFAYCDSGIFDRTHLRFFTKKSMARLFREAGYDIVRLEGLKCPGPERTVKRVLLNFASRLVPAVQDIQHLQFAVVGRPSNREGAVPR